MSGNRVFKQIASNLSGSDYIKNKKSKAIYKSYKETPDKVNKNVTINNDYSLASAESYDMLNLLTNGKDLTYNRNNDCVGETAMSLQNLQSSNDIWKGSLLKNEAGKVGYVSQDFNEQLYIQSIYGTNGPVGCVTENNSTSSIRFTRCGNPGKSTEPADAPLPTKSTSTALDTDSPLYVTPGKSEVYGIKLSDAFNDAAYFEITADINQGIGFSITDDYKVEVFLNKSVPVLQTYIVTVIPYNVCREKADQSNYQTFEVKAQITTNNLQFDSPLYVGVGQSNKNSRLLSEAFPYATSYHYAISPAQTEGSDDITVTTDSDQVKVEISSSVTADTTYGITVTPSNENGSWQSKDFNAKATPQFASPLEIVIGETASNSVKLSDAFPSATTFNTSLSTTSQIANPGNLKVTTENDEISIQVTGASLSDITYTITVSPEDSEVSKTFEVVTKPVTPTATDVAIGTISVPSQSFASSQDTLSAYFNNANNGYTTHVDLTSYNIEVKIQENKIFVVNNEESVWGASIGATIEPNDEFGHGISSQSKPFTILLVESSV